MASRLVVDVFCEDSGHEIFLRNLIKVLAQAIGISTPELRIHCARGGHGRAISALNAWQRAVRIGRQPRGDALLVLIDANSTGWRPMLRSIHNALDLSLYPTVIVACPDPQVEVWCTADPEPFQALFSVAVPASPTQSGRLVYKQWLTTALEQAGEIVLTDPMDICLDLLPAMDLVKASQKDASLGHLVRDLRAFLIRNRPAHPSPPMP
jgi:hypothetical protein